MTALTLGIVAAFAWGFHDICIRWLSQSVPLLASLLAVLVTGLVFHSGFMVWHGDLAPLNGPALIYALASGLTFLLASLGLYGAFQRGPVRLVAPVIASYPVLSVAWAALRGAEVSTLQWLAVLAVVAGVSAVAALADEDRSDVPPKGRTILYAAASAVGFATTFALGQLAVETSDELSVSFVTRSVAIVVLIAIIAVARVPFWAGLRALPVLALMGLADAIALACMMAAGLMPDAQYAAVAASCFGLLTIVLAWAILRERMTAMQWLGCVVTFAGIGYLAM
ncbi:DMT family transporter [Sulfitobacter sp. 20_GPM-1509m]|uniref:DMT family transporter n=1 Tax=Sulfitobacter sp. 20_GPM-1509m TaxID=1380367 RepID=UPI00048FA6F0|nr:DMT family transporter [Sulfitobacter sp. 20_GPM-1509m]